MNKQYLAQVNKEYTIAFQSFSDRKDYISRNVNAKTIGNKSNKLPVIEIQELILKQVAIAKDEEGYLFVYPDYESNNNILIKRHNSEVLVSVSIKQVLDYEDVVNLDNILKSWFINQTMNDDMLDTLISEDVRYDNMLKWTPTTNSSIDCRNKDDDQVGEELKLCTCEDDFIFNEDEDDDTMCEGCTDCDESYRLSTCPLYLKNTYNEGCTCGYEESDDDPVSEYIMNSDIRHLIEVYYV